jgi:hypothetical protein
MWPAFPASDYYGGSASLHIIGRHSSIRYVSPAQRHNGDDHAILAARHEVYVQARERNPARWSRCTRDWTPIGAVTLNPERESVVTMASHATPKQPLAA